MPEPDAFSIAVICTGNRARSPLAAAFLRGLTAELPVEVRSAGVLDLGPVGALAGALSAGTALGVDLFAHRAAWAGGADLSTCDLVLGFERQHVAFAVVDAGAVRGRAFTLPELVALLDEAPAEAAADDPVSGARAAVARADARRPAGPAAVAEIADPLGASEATFHETAREIRRLCERLVAGLFG